MTATARPLTDAERRFVHELRALLRDEVRRCTVCRRVLGDGEVAGFDRTLKFCQACCDALEDETIKDQAQATSEGPKAA